MKECPKCQSCFDDMQSYCTFDDSFLLPSIAGSHVISGRYILEKRLGTGGMGIVYKARHKFLKSFHAVKLILPSLPGSNAALLNRFNQEAILAASINHPNVIRVTDFGIENDSLPFLVMEFIDGTPLIFHLLANKKLSPAKALEIFRPIASGVAEAHRKEIVHRDLKPQNIMLQHNLALEKSVKVLDFGLAKIKSTDASASFAQSETLNTIGSPAYMSPEQWENTDIDHRTDIYSLGIILFQMLTGNVPFQGDSLPAIMYQHLSASPPSFSSLGLPDSPEVESVLQRALLKNPADRFSTVEEMLDAFEKAVVQSEKISLKTNPEFDFYSNSPPPIPAGNENFSYTTPHNLSETTVDAKKEIFEINLQSTPKLKAESDEKITVASEKPAIGKTNFFLSKMIAGAAGLAFLIALIGGYEIYNYTAPYPANIVNTSSPKPPETNENFSYQSLPENMKQMVLINGGSFQMGRDDVPPQDIVWGNQYPEHPVSVNSFYLSKTEVSNEDYVKFTEETKHPAPENWLGGRIPNGQEKFPVTFVSLFDAKDYAEWFSKKSSKICRVPTEEEWEFAARNGGEQTSFPWGNNWQPNLANIATGNSSNVGSFSDETTIGGIKDMLGSVIEWTSSNYSLYAAHPGKLESPGKDLFVIRGSSFGESQDRLKNADWILTRRQAVAPEQKSPFLGFRLACQP